MRDPTGSPVNMVSEEELDRIRQIASTDAGKDLRDMMNSVELHEAAAKGDMETLKNAVARLLKTDAGKKLAGRITDMMNGK